MYAFAIGPRAHAVKAIAIERICLAVLCYTRKYVVAGDTVRRRIAVVLRYCFCARPPYHLRWERSLREQLSYVVIELRFQSRQACWKRQYLLLCLLSVTGLVDQLHIVKRVGAILVEATNVIDLTFVEIVGQFLRAKSAVAVLTFSKLLSRGAGELLPTLDE